jgi:hypothetical protein
MERLRTWILVASLALLAAGTGARPAHASEDAEHGEGGYGFFGTLVAFNQAQAESSRKWEGELTGGFGLFGEYLPLPYLALGLEADLAFPRIERKSGDRCAPCRRDVFLQILGRLKLPVRTSRNTSFFPIFHVGYSHLHHITTDRKTGYDGLGFGGGLGVEVYTNTSAVSLELRYAGHYTPASTGPEELLDHFINVAFGFRLL